MWPGRLGYVEQQAQLHADAGVPRRHRKLAHFGKPGLRSVVIENVDASVTRSRILDPASGKVGIGEIHWRRSGHFAAGATDHRAGFLVAGWIDVAADDQRTGCSKTDRRLASLPAGRAGN